MSRLFLGLMLALASCGDSPTVRIETPQTSRLYDRDELRASSEERYAMRVGQLGTASCYLEVDRESECGPATFRRCREFDLREASPNIEILKVVQVVGEPARVAFIARTAGSGQLVLRAEGIEKPLSLVIREPEAP